MTPRSKPLCYKYITKNFKPTRHKTKFQIPTEATSTTISQPKGQPVRNTFSRGHGFFRSSKTSAGLSLSLSLSLCLSLFLSRSVCSIRAATNHRPSCNHGKDWQPCYRDRDSTVPFILEPVRGRLNISRQRSTDTLTGDKAKYGSGRFLLGRRRNIIGVY